ncbi:N-acetyltransferase family protein [Primorskyibacter sp. S187A]|uniref:GNAT family N-acetyltransferase n=1 Tax=Primorskyibacter sp. S187A TaxID=3415130 RepID=UPI003C79937A
MPLLKQVQALHARHVPHRFHKNGTDEAYLAHFRHGIEERSGFVLCASTAGQDVGYLFAVLDAAEEDAFCCAREEMVLDQICVDCNAHRQGVATALIEAFETRVSALGLARWRASHWVFNQASAALLLKAGARPGVMAVSKEMPNESADK